MKTLINSLSIWFDLILLMTETVNIRVGVYTAYRFLSIPEINITSQSCWLSKYVRICCKTPVAWLSQWKYSSCWLIVLATDVKLAKLKSRGIVSSVSNVERELDATKFDSWLGLLLLDIFNFGVFSLFRLIHRYTKKELSQQKLDLNRFVLWTIKFQLKLLNSLFISSCFRNSLSNFNLFGNWTPLIEHNFP